MTSDSRHKDDPVHILHRIAPFGSRIFVRPNSWQRWHCTKSLLRLRSSKLNQVFPTTLTGYMFLLLWFGSRPTKKRRRGILSLRLMTFIMLLTTVCYAVTGSLSVISSGANWFVLPVSFEQTLLLTLAVQSRCVYCLHWWRCSCLLPTTLANKLPAETGS